MSIKSFAHVAALCAVAGTSFATAQAQWLPEYQVYSIQRIGLFGPEQGEGVPFSSLSAFNNSALIAGSSWQYVASGIGRNTWVYNVSTGTTVQTGLTAPANIGSGGLRYSETGRQNAAGAIIGRSQRYTGANSSNGFNTWVYNPITNTTVQTGFTGPGYTGSGGYQSGENELQNATGQIAGRSARVRGVNGDNGASSWVYDLATNTTVQTGLTGTANTGSLGYQFSRNTLLNDAGQVAGFSWRVTGVNTFNGNNFWVDNPTTNATVQTGFTGAAYTGTNGYQNGQISFQNEYGQVAGYSQRVTGVNTINGQDTWVYNPTTNTTVQTGLTGADYTGSGGAQYSQHHHQNAAGQVIGSSRRYTESGADNGLDAWVYSAATNSTVQVGLIGAGYTGSAGYRYSVIRSHSESELVVGRSDRFVDVDTEYGADAWVYNPATNSTSQIGLTGPSQTGSEGYRYSEPGTMNNAGQLVGTSRIITGVRTNIGQNTWFYNPVTGTTSQIGLTGPANTSITGSQYSQTQGDIVAGQVVGHSFRYSGLAQNRGVNTWVYDIASDTTVLTGLTGPTYTGSEGYQESVNYLQNNFGQVAGYSLRVTGVDTVNGRDTWYFDPATSLTSAIIGSVRTADNYAYSMPTILTEGGFLLGNYMYFDGGVGDGEQRAFIFRPDLGLTDLGNLVNGGLNASGWSTLRSVQFSVALNAIIGYGYVNGQTTGQSVFVLTIPSPGTAALIGLGCLLATRRRRCA